MNLTTRHFGEITVDEDTIIDFPSGLPAFEKATKFTIIENDEQESPFKWLQCLDEPNLTFAIINPFEIISDYDFEVDDRALVEIDLKNPDELVVFSILVIPEDVQKTSMNLKAPLLINVNTRKGMQVILDTDKYGVRHCIIDEIKRAGGGIADAGAGKEEGAVHHSK